MLWLLLKNKINVFLNGFLKGDVSKRRRKLFALIGGTILFYFLFQWTYEIFNIIYLSQPDGILIINNILVLFFTGFFVFLLATGITISAHYLFISTDLPLLMSAPLSSTIIFSYKLIENIFANSSFFFFLGMPIFISYGVVIHAPWFYYPFMLVTALIFLALPVSISFLIALSIVRIIPAIRVKEIMAGLLGVISLLMWLSIQMLRVSHFDSHSPDFNPERIEQIKQLTQRPIFEVLPSTWAAKSLSAFSLTNWHSVFAEIIPLLLSTVLIFMVCLSFTRQLFKRGLLSSQFEVAQRKKRKFLRMKKDGIAFSSVIGTIFLRDFKLLARDFRHLTHVLILVVMMVVFPLIRSSEQITAASVDYLPFILIIIFSAIISGQLTSRLIPFEGKSFWVMMILPQSWMKMLIGKFFVGFIFNLISVWLAVLVSCIYFSTPVRICALAFLITMFISCSTSIYGLTIGSLLPKFDWDHPKRMLTTGGGLILSFGALLSVGIWAGLIAIVYVIGSFLKYSTLLSDVIVVIISLVIVFLTIVIGLSISSKKLSSLDWSL